MPFPHEAGGKFGKRDDSILVYMPNYCRADIEFNRLYTVYLFQEILPKFMLCISLDNFETNQRF